MSHGAITIAAADVLLIEQPNEAAELTISALRDIQSDVSVEVVTSAQQALYYIFRAGAYANRDAIPPRMVLLNLDTPGIGGLHVLERMKRDPNAALIPAIVLSAHAHPDIIHHCFALGANSVLQKPEDAQSYKALISRVGEYWLKINVPARIDGRSG